MSKLDEAAVAAQIGRSPRTVRDWRNAGRFPKPDGRDGRKPVWDAATIAAWQGGDGASLKPVGDAKPKPQEPDFKREEEGDRQTVSYKSDVKITTLEDALKHAEVDLSVWRVKKWGCGAWQVGMKIVARNEKGQPLGDTPHVENLWRVWLELERILPKSWQDATEALIKRMEKHSPKYPKIITRARPKDPHMLEVDLADHHFGKLAWAPETGSNYDLRIAEKVYKHAVEDLLNRAAGFEIDTILIPLGNDFFHIDNAQNATTAGTPQDVDGRQEKIIEVGTASVIAAIERMMTIANVEILRVPGNHDRATSLHLARFIAAWFRLSGRVKVDYSPKTRKYKLYGQNLLGFTHGNEEKHADLPSIMAHEERELWSQARYAEMHLGHFHKAKELRTKPLDTYGGVAVRFLMSLSGIDAWHYLRGYTTSLRAAECFLWGRKPGLAGHFTATVREG